MSGSEKIRVENCLIRLDVFQFIIPILHIEVDRQHLKWFDVKKLVFGVDCYIRLSKIIIKFARKNKYEWQKENALMHQMRNDWKYKWVIVSEMALLCAFGTYWITRFLHFYCTFHISIKNRDTDASRRV